MRTSKLDSPLTIYGVPLSVHTRKVIVTAKDTFALTEWSLPEDPVALEQTGLPEEHEEDQLPPLRPVERHPEVALFEDDRVGVGFKSIHVRSRIPAPLAGREVPLAALIEALGAPDRGEIALGGALVVGGFAFAFGGGHVYGHEDGGQVLALAVAGGMDTRVLATFARDHQLILVDWCAASVERF